MKRTNGFGWLRDWPDFRDYSAAHEDVEPLLELTALGKTKGRERLSASVDLRQWCPPIEDQETIGSCTAQAGVALVEYFQKRATGEHLDASRLFLYKVTRKLDGFEGDTGAYLRTTAKALRLFGAPPEEYWPYDVAKFNEEPTPFLYQFAANFKSMKFYRHDPYGSTPADVLASIKANLDSGLPSMFGFSVFSSMWNVDGSGEIPYPAPSERFEGGHAMVAIGYDDNRQIANPDPSGPTTTGAFLIRNSWGVGWGDNGYGWLPFEYVSQGQATDWWTLITQDWVDTGKFA